MARERPKTCSSLVRHSAVRPEQQSRKRLGTLHRAAAPLSPRLHSRRRQERRAQRRRNDIREAIQAERSAAASERFYRSDSQKTSSNETTNLWELRITRS